MVTEGLLRISCELIGLMASQTTLNILGAHLKSLKNMKYTRDGPKYMRDGPKYTVVKQYTVVNNMSNT